MNVTLSLFAGAGAQFLDDSGNVLTGGKVYTYSAGTTTPLATYTSNLGNTAHANPIVLNAAGRVPTGEIWLTNGLGYKFVVQDSNNVLIATYDNIPSSAQPPIINDASSIAYELGTVINAGSFIIGNTYQIKTLGTTNFQTIGASANQIGVYFTATGVGTGSGTAYISRTVQAALQSMPSLADFDNQTNFDNYADTLTNPVNFAIQPQTTIRTLKSKLNDVVSVKDFGAVGDGVADDTAAIQAAIDWAVYQNVSGGAKPSLGSVYLPGGIYKISKTLQLGYGESYHSVHIYGDGKRFNNGASIGPQFCGTGIITTFNDAPAIAVNGGRGTTIKDLSIMGLNYSWIVDHNLGAFAAPTLNDLVASNWVDPSFPASASSRYAPYCAIAIDPYAGTQPAVSYPNVTFPAWSGITTQYGKNYSSDTLIEGVYINGFVAGVVNQPCDADGNGDFTKIINCEISQCQYGVSIGNTQSRTVKISNTPISQNYTVISTGIYGKQLGKPQIFIDNCDISFSIYLMDVPNTSFGCNVTFLNCYSECLYSLGNASLGVSISQSPVVFENCEFAFQSWVYRGIPAYIFKSTYGSVVFRNTFISNGSATQQNIFYVNAPANFIVVDNCVLQAGASATKYYEKHGINATGGIVANSAGTNFTAFNVLPSVTWNLNTGANITPQYISNSTSTTNRTYCVPLYSKNLRAANAGDAGFLNNPPANPFDKTTAVSISSAGKIVTVDYTAVISAWQFIQNGGDVGDVIVDSETNAVFFVSARTGSVLTLVAQTGLDSSGNLLQAPTKTGIFWALNCRTYTPYYVTLGDTTAGNATISNFQRPDGYAAYINSADNGVQINDNLFVGTGTNINPTSQTAGLITAIGATSITLDSNMNFTDAHTRQKVFIRKAPANNT